MTVAARQADKGSDRLARFRGLRARLDPTGDPGRALANGLYVEPARSVSSRIAAELMLSPTSTHLLSGGVGSGKTTELLSVQLRLNEVTDTRAFYIDTSRDRDPGKMPPGALVVQAGLAFGEELVKSAPPGDERSAVEQELRELRNVAFGYHEYYEVLEQERDDPRFVRVPGILEPHDRLETTLSEALRVTRPLLEPLRARWKHPLVLLDGLDRMTDMGSFEQLVEHDLRTLTSLGVGIVLVGPLKALYGIDRALIQRFDQFHYQPWIDPVSGPEAGAFLANVLQRRVPDDALDREGREHLVLSSGGVLRDLLSLAQSACVESYMDGSDVMGRQQVESAADSFGRKHMQGLRPAEIEVLQRVLAKGSFVQTSEEDLALLMTRRVLEYRSNGRPRFAVHPTIAPFLREMADAG